MKKTALFSILAFCLAMLSVGFVFYLIASTDSTSNAERIYPLAFTALFVVIILIMTGFGCLIKWLVAFRFGICPAFASTIILTNLIIQLIIYYTLFVLFAVALFSVIYPAAFLLKVLACITEYNIYRRFMDFSKRKVLLYTICANIVALLGGILLIFTRLFL